jgi:hypothetical protein
MKINPEEINARGRWTDAEITHRRLVLESIENAKQGIDDVNDNFAGQYYGLGDRYLSFYALVLEELKRDLAELDKVKVALPYELQEAVV